MASRLVERFGLSARRAPDADALADGRGREAGAQAQHRRANERRVVVALVVRAAADAVVGAADDLVIGQLMNGANRLADGGSKLQQAASYSGT